MKNVIKRTFFIIREMIDENKLIFILMIAGLILSDFVMIYFIGNYKAYRNSSLDGAGAVRYPAENNLNLSYDEILSLDYGDYGNLTPAFSASVSPDNVKMTDGGLITDGYGLKGSFFVVCAAGDGFPCKSYLGDCEIKDGREDVIILPCTKYTEGLKYDGESESYGTVDFYGRTLYIKGVSAYDNEAIIPFSLFSSTFAPKNVSFYCDKLLSEKQSDALRDKIYSDFGCSGLVDPYSYYRAADRGYAALIVILFIAYLISLSCFVFYILYFTKRRAKSNAVAYICGAGKKQLITEILLSNEVISLLCFAVSLCLKLLPDLFYSVKYELKDYISMLLIVVISTLIASAPSVSALKKSTAAELYRNVT